LLDPAVYSVLFPLPPKAKFLPEWVIDNSVVEEVRSSMESKEEKLDQLEEDQSGEEDD
jgi:hypothetical protein